MPLLTDCPNHEGVINHYTCQIQLLVNRKEKDENRIMKESRKVGRQRIKEMSSLIIWGRLFVFLFEKGVSRILREMREGERQKRKERMYH